MIRPQPFRWRHREPPEVNACRWCGVPYRDHVQIWVPSRGFHSFENPTDAQRIARLKARARARSTK